MQDGTSWADLEIERTARKTDTLAGRPPSQPEHACFSLLDVKRQVILWIGEGTT
jgi:hypothetical protein